jgi:glutaredoxin
MPKASVTIYSRPNCHLCDEAKSAVRAAGCEDEFVLVEVDIDTDPRLIDLYGNDIPVIFINDKKAFKHRVDPNEFKRKLARL